MRSLMFFPLRGRERGGAKASSACTAHLHSNWWPIEMEQVSWHCGFKKPGNAHGSPQIPCGGGMGVHAGAGASETGGDEDDILIEPVPITKGNADRGGASDSA